MAIHFKKNMVWCWKDKEITKGIIGFTFKDDKFRFDFRDKLSTNISNDKGLIIQRLQEGVYASCDILLGLFDKKDEEVLHSFFNKKIPGLFTFIFRHKYYKNWQEEWLSIRRLAKVEIETNHDFPGILIESTIYSSEELSLEVNKVATELGLEMYKNKELEKINIYTNRTLDFKMGTDTNFKQKPKDRVDSNF